MKNLLQLTTLVLLCYCTNSFSQEGIPNLLPSINDHVLKNINDQAGNISRRLLQQSEKYLRHLATEEKKLQKKLALKDSSAAQTVLADTKKFYQTYINHLHAPPGYKLPTQYFSRIDTLRTVLAMVRENNFRNNHVIGNITRLTDALENVDRFQTGMDRVVVLEELIQKRSQELQDRLAKYGLAKELLRWKKHAGYYRLQVEEYKRIVADPKKLQAKALTYLTRTALFRDFFRKHSHLAALFALPEDPTGDDGPDRHGLQTRNSVKTDMLSRFGSVPEVSQVMQQQPHGTETPVQGMKELFRRRQTSDQAAPADVKPNSQKVKQFRERLEFGMNLQTVKGSFYFPSSTDIGVSIGYKLNDRSLVGIGAAYKMGWGKDIRHIVITHEGAGARSFFDYRLKGNTWLTGNVELAHRARFKDFDVLKNYSSWQKAALLGVGRKYRISEKLKGNIQLMYDLLWKMQVPRSQAILFRIGYNL